MDCKFIEENRLISFDWHIARAVKWLDFDNGRKLDNVLFYCSLDLRCAIERYHFEFILLLKGDDKITPGEERECRTMDGMARVLRRLKPDYRKLCEFCNLLSSVLETPKFVVVDFRFLKRSWHDLSNYCHKQLRTTNPTGRVDVEDKNEGFALINEVIEKFRAWEEEGFCGIMPRNKMVPEVRELCDKYIRDEISAEGVKTQLNLAAPILKVRMRFIN